MSNSPVLAEVSSDLSQSDLSVQLLGKVFGSGWDRLAETLAGGASDGAMGTLIYSLLAVLNAVCAIVVAWLCILTTLSAALGAAQDGSGIGGRRFSSAWIPLRLSFAMGAVTPVFNARVEFAGTMTITKTARYDNSSLDNIIGSHQFALEVGETGNVKDIDFLSSELCVEQRGVD